MKRITFAILILACIAVFAIEPVPPSLSINPTAVTLPPGTSQYFIASFTDGSQMQSCAWAATGVGKNGVKLITTNEEWAVFSDGTLRGVTYMVSGTCTNTAGVRGSANALVSVR